MGWYGSAGNYGICQSCGMPLAAKEHFGTESDNTPTTEYCCFCYKGGGFTDSFTPEEKIADSVAYHDEADKQDGRTVTRQEMSLRLHALTPELKRWRSHNITHAEYYRAVNRVVEYINDNLDSVLNLGVIASEANISGFHFHRIFRAVMGESPGDYIQRLRLEKAAFRLQTTTDGISEIAERLGYASHHALTRAFTRRYGITPSRFRKEPFIKDWGLRPVEDLGIEPEIRVEPERRVLFTRVIDPLSDPGAFLKAWSRLAGMVPGATGQDVEHILFSHDASTITHPVNYRMYACVTGYKGKSPAGNYGLKTLPGGTYAVFTHRGAYRDLDTVYCHIYRHWLPASRYNLADTTYFERFLNSPARVPRDELLTEICIPVVAMQ